MDLCYIFFVVIFRSYTSVFWCSLCLGHTETTILCPLDTSSNAVFLIKDKIKLSLYEFEKFLLVLLVSLFVVFYYSVTSHFCVCSQHPQCFHKLTNVFFLPPVPKGKPWDTVILYACLLLNELQVEDKRNNFIPYPHMCKNAARKKKKNQPFSLR